MAIELKFKSGGTDAIAADADFQSDRIDISLNYVWVVTSKSSGIVGGPGTYSIEVSDDDGVNWETYPGAGGIAIGTSFKADCLQWTSMRINYLKATTTAGTVTFPLTLKR